MADVEIKLYSNAYKQELNDLLIKFSQELFGDGTANVDEFIDYHWCVYLAIRDDKVIGMSSYIFNTYFGLRTPTVGNDYLYVLPEHRGSRAMWMLAVQTGKISVENNLPLEHYYASEQTIRVGRKMEGVKAYSTYIYSVEEVKRVFNHLISKVKFKE